MRRTSLDRTEQQISSGAGRGAGQQRESQQRPVPMDCPKKTTRNARSGGRRLRRRNRVPRMRPTQAEQRGDQFSGKMEDLPVFQRQGIMPYSRSLPSTFLLA